MSYKQIDKQVEGRKDVVCYRCGSNKVTAYFYLSNEEKPCVSFDCAECKEHDMQTPIMGVEVNPESLSSIFDMEDLANETSR